MCQTSPTFAFASCMIASFRLLVEFLCWIMSLDLHESDLTIPVLHVLAFSGTLNRITLQTHESQWLEEHFLKDKGGGEKM